MRVATDKLSRMRAVGLDFFRALNIKVKPIKRKGHVETYQCGIGPSERLTAQSGF